MGNEGTKAIGNMLKDNNLITSLDIRKLIIYIIYRC